MSSTQATAAVGTGRVIAVDVARTAALAGMVVFHVARDLEMFGLVPPGTTLEGGWALLARLVAGSFLFLVGISLALAHGTGLRLRPFLRRLMVIAGAAALVSVGTWFVAPERFVYFGILHAIAVASLLAVPFASAPALVPALVAILILSIDIFFGRGLNLSPWMGWTGLAVWPRPALDLIPMFPWLAVTFSGMTVARVFRIGSWRGSSTPFTRMLALPGRHSLLIYLVHQPLLLGIIWTIVKLAGVGAGQS